MKKIKFLLVLFVAIILVTGCEKKEEVKGETDATKFKEEYESLNGTINEKSGSEIRTISISEDNPIIYKEASDIVDAIENKETFLVYFGFASCPWCRSVVPTMLSVASELGIKEIYYVDVLEIRDTLTLGDNNKVVESVKGTDAYYELLDLLNPVLSDYILYGYNDKNVNTKEKRIYAPNVVAIVDGTPTMLESGISDLETDPYMELTDEINEDMKNKFTCLMECLTKNTCTNKTC